MTAATISSSISEVSTFAGPESPPGEGGGVSARRPELLGRWSSKRRGVCCGGDMDIDEELEWERFCFFATCCPSLVVGGERMGRGNVIPSMGSERDFLRVLYGMVVVVGFAERIEEASQEEVDEA